MSALNRWLFLLVDVEDVLQRERLEVQPVGGVVVRRDRLGVAVDHDGLHAQLAEREGGVDAAVIELDALADPVGAGAQDDDLAPFRRRGLVLLLVRGVEIGRVGLELGGARVHRLEGGRDAVARAQRADLQLGAAGQRGDAPVGEAELLGPAQRGGVGERVARDLGLELDDLADVLEEPRIDPAQLVDLVGRQSRPVGVADREEPVGIRDPDQLA